MNSREFKDFVYGEFARIGKTLSSPKRIELLDLLTQGPKSVEALAAETKMGTANTSKHLQALLDAKLVSFAKEKNYVIYELAGEQVMHLVLALRRAAEEQIPGVQSAREEFIRPHDGVQTVELDELEQKASEGAITLIDVRPAAEFAAGHLPRAMSIPLAELEARAESLPKDREVVAYCRGPYCVYATEAVTILRSKGFRATLLEAGVNEWKAMQR